MPGLRASTVLQNAHTSLRTVKFDPKNKEHIRAFVMLHYSGRQHPTLRFIVEQPFLDVRSMMIDKLIRKSVGKALELGEPEKMAA